MFPEALYAYLPCGILAYGFVRLGCDTCAHQVLLAFSGTDGDLLATFTRPWSDGTTGIKLSP